MVSSCYVFSKGRMDRHTYIYSYSDRTFPVLNHDEVLVLLLSTFSRGLPSKLQVFLFMLMMLRFTRTWEYTIVMFLYNVNLNLFFNKIHSMLMVYIEIWKGDSIWCIYKLAIKKSHLEGENFDRIRILSQKILYIFDYNDWINRDLIIDYIILNSILFFCVKKINAIGVYSTFLRHISRFWHKGAIYLDLILLSYMSINGFAIRELETLQA